MGHTWRGLRSGATHGHHHCSKSQVGRQRLEGKIRDRERLEPPHVTILRRTLAWHVEAGTMNDPIFVVARGKPAYPFARIQSVLLRDGNDFRRAYADHRRAMWVLPDVRLLAMLTKALRARDVWHRLLILHKASTARRETLAALFRVVIAPDDGVQLLPREELVEVLASPKSEDLIIGGIVDRDDNTIVLYRGNLERLVVQLDWVRAEGKGTKLNLSAFKVTDFGQTICFGNFEIATDAILYEFDAEARKRMRKRELKQDSSFGAALHRLRLQKRVSREDFPRVSAKTIARIERGEVEKPHSETLEIIARKLGVRVEEIGTY
jgi:hypothetical protein